MDNTDNRSSPGASLREVDNQIDGLKSRSGNASLSTSPSPSGSTTDIDLDLDSLFKRLDKYTAEMEEVEARLKRNRSASDNSSHLNIKRFSFEIDQPTSDALVPNSAGVLPKSEWFQTNSPTHGKAEDPRDVQEVKRTGGIFGDAAEDLDEPFLIIQSNAESHPKPSFAPPSDEDQLSGHLEKVVASRRVVVERESDLYLPIQNNNVELAECLPKEAATNQENRHSSTTLKPTSPYAEETPRTPGLQKGMMRTELDWTDFQGLQGQEASYTPEELEYSDLDEPCHDTPIGWTFPPRTSSKPFSIGDQAERALDSPPKPLQRRTTADSRQSVRHGGFWSAPPLLLLEQEPMPSLPSLSHSGSEATANASPPLTPLTLCSPREDQIRRELESFALHDGAETLELKYKQRRPPRLDLVSSDEDLLEIDEERWAAHEAGRKDQGVSEPSRPRPRRSKSIRSIFQRRSPIEKVIDLYLDDEAEAKPARPSKWATISRRGSPTTANMPQSPRVPPLPSSPSFPTNLV